MKGPGIPTFDQIKVFLAVVDAESFTAAGRRLNRATSAISYAIANLELQLGVELFDRETTRRPRLTDAGGAVLARARTLAATVDELRACVSGLLGGLEAEVSLVVDVMFPRERLTAVLHEFDMRHPTVRLRLHVEALEGAAGFVAAGGAVIGVGGGMHSSHSELTVIHAGTTAMIPVAAPYHALARMEVIPAGASRHHRQLVLTGRSSTDKATDVGIFGEQTWRIADLGAKHDLLLVGMGWGYMPEHLVARDLAEGRLVRLALPEGSGTYPFQVLYRTANPPGPAGAWLVHELANSMLFNGR